MQSVPITTDVVSSNLDHGNVYNIMYYFTPQKVSSLLLFKTYLVMRKYNCEPL